MRSLVAGARASRTDGNRGLDKQPPQRMQPGRSIWRRRLGGPLDERAGHWPLFALPDTAVKWITSRPVARCERTTGRLKEENRRG